MEYKGRIICLGGGTHPFTSNDWRKNGVEVLVIENRYHGRPVGTLYSNAFEVVEDRNRTHKHEYNGYQHDLLYQTPLTHRGVV